jgi:iron only hydrogenase large subunit-like protein
MKEYFHSVKLIEENCKGCTKCMINCPVEAIRLKNSKALIYEDVCIDCGECIRVCPYNAHVAQKDSLDALSNFKINIVIPSVTLYLQFGEYINPSLVNEGIIDLGFDEVFDTTYACDIVSEITKKEIEKMYKPAISPFCLGVVRLIQTNYPSLLDHVVKVLTPIEVAANLIREKYRNLGYKDEDIGVFYLTPCTAWVTKVKMSSLNKKSQINGAIAISDIFQRLLRHINKKRHSIEEQPLTMSFAGLSWGATGGQSNSMGISEYIAVDGVKNVIKVLDEVENGKYKEIEFIDALACDGGCLGGMLLVDNPFNAKRILRKYCYHLNFTYKFNDPQEYYKNEFFQDVHILKISNKKLADDFESAVKKMKYMNELINNLPGIDCGQCGSPSCKAFAEDVVRGLCNVNECKMINIGGENNESI